MDSTTDLLKTVDVYVRRSFHDQSPPQVKDLARELGITRFTLNKKFRLLTGVTLGTHFNQRRMECAKRLLRSTNWKVKTIARHAAFSDQQSFSRAFRRETGMTPTEFRRSGGSHA